MQSYAYTHMHTYISMKSYAYIFTKKSAEVYHLNGF